MDFNKNTYSVTLQPDEEGMIGRQCGREECKKYFKIDSKDCGEFQNIEMYCPYCGSKEFGNNFYTEDQLKYATSVITADFMGEINKQMKKLEQKPDPHAFISIGVTYTPGKIEIRKYVEKDLKTKINCEKCDRSFALYSVSSFCPFCGKRDDKIIYDQNIQVVKKFINLQDVIPEKEKEDLDEFLDIISNTPELTLFFKKLFEDTSYWKFFFLHREELFPVIDGNFLKYVFWNSVTSNPERAFKILSNQAELKVIASKSSQDEMKASIFPEDLVKLLQDPIIYSLIKFIRENPIIIELIKNETFDYSLMKQKLGDYSLINSKIIDEISNVFSGKQVDDSDFMRMLLSLVGGFQGSLKDWASNIGHHLPNVSDSFPGVFLNIHSVNNSHLTQLLNLSDITKADYTTLLTELHSQKNIRNLNTIFWCQNCVDENIVLNSESSLNPYHLKLTCPRCSNELLASSVFELDEIIEEAIMDKDGLLQLATAWSLYANEIEFETNVSDGEFEYDFVCKIPSHNMLLECKVHRQKHDERQLKLWIESDLKQLSDHYNKIKDSQDIKHCFIVSNIDVSKNINLINKIRKKYPEQIGFANIAALPSLIQKIKPQ